MSLTEEDKQWIVERLGALETRLDDKLVALETRHNERLNGRLEAVETRLLTAFHDFASPRDARSRSHSVALVALDEEVESLKRRVEKLENRPHA